MQPKYAPVDVARQFLFVREAQSLGQNRGQRVESIIRWCGGEPGQSWCAFFITMVLDIAYQGNAPIPRGGSCQAIYDQAKAKVWVRTIAKTGMLYLYVDAYDHAHHVGIITSGNSLGSPLVGIAGNTSSDGTSSNGDGVYEHAIKARVFVEYPLG